MADLGTVTITETRLGVPKKVKFDWTSVSGGGDAGKATKTTTYAYSGEIIALVTVPSAITPPTDDYDITITDTDSVDVLLGAGADRDSVATEIVKTGLGVVAMDKLTINVTNAGNAKLGTAYLYIR